MNLDADATELACLHRQVTLRKVCSCSTRHQALADFMVGRYAKDAPQDVQARMRAACGPRGGR